MRPVGLLRGERGPRAHLSGDLERREPEDGEGHHPYRRGKGDSPPRGVHLVRAVVALVLMLVCQRPFTATW